MYRVEREFVDAALRTQTLIEIGILLLDAQNEKGSEIVVGDGAVYVLEFVAKNLDAIEIFVENSEVGGGNSRKLGNHCSDRVQTALGDSLLDSLSENFRIFVSVFMSRSQKNRPDIGKLASNDTVRLETAIVVKLVSSLEIGS